MWNCLALNEKDSAKVKKEDSAIDHGGPTRQFFAQFWKQMLDIRVTYKSVKHPSVKPNNKVETEHEINLFVSSSSGVCPMNDEHLQEKSSKAVEGERDEEQSLSQLLSTIDDYYCAVGLVMFRAIVGEHPIAPYAMPRFWRNGKNPFG